MRTTQNPHLALVAILAASIAVPLNGCSSKPDPAAIEAMKRQQAEAAKSRRDAATQRQADKAFEKLDKDFED